MEDGNPCQGWYSAVQPPSVEKRWKLVCVCVCACRLWLQGSRWASKLPQLCAKDLHYRVRDGRSKAAERLCLTKKLCVGKSG